LFDTHAIKTCCCCPGLTCKCHHDQKGVKQCAPVLDQASDKLLPTTRVTLIPLSDVTSPAAGVYKAHRPDLVVLLRLCEATAAPPPDRCTQAQLCLWLL
jgi:hypothetical protein